nr:MAG TPA: hypothetical protein [Inoviridae sp.]
MKKISSYLPSLLISIVLVFTFIGTAVIALTDININANSCISLAKKNALEKGIYTEIEKNYKSKYNSTGIPAEVYMDAISEDYIISVEESYINAGFKSLKSGEKMQVKRVENDQLEKSIEDFFSNYADESGHAKDEIYDQKLAETIDGAYGTISSYCDVYKLSALDNHGVLSKLSKLYSFKTPLTIALAATDVVLIVLLLLINLKNKLVVYYWAGTSALVSAILGLTPSVYLAVTKYYDSFSIKQQQVFTAYTSMMYEFTEAFIAVQTAMAVLGISLIVIYGVMYKKYVLANEK